MISFPIKAYMHTHTYAHILNGINATVCSTPAELPGIVSPPCPWFPGCNRGRTTHTFAHGEREAQG